MKKKILYIGGSLNQTEMMHKISNYLNEYDNYFTTFYADGFVDLLAKKGMLDWTILGGGSNFQKQSIRYLKENKLNIDYRGEKHDYDLVVTGSDLIVPHNVRGKRLILVQEGMTDPVNFWYYMVKWFKLPRWVASTSTNGLSDAYDLFCVASEGYKEHFIKSGVKESKIRITGIPNYDDLAKYKYNNFPLKNFVLCATSDARETKKYENRKKILEDAVRIANGRQLVFKLHPNENFKRAREEINKYAPGSIIYEDGNVHEMIANCDVLITQYSTVVYTGIALGKEVYSEFDIDYLKKITPIQNGGKSAENIAKYCKDILDKVKKDQNIGNQGILKKPFNLKSALKQKQANKQN